MANIRHTSVKPLKQIGLENANHYMYSGNRIDVLDHVLFNKEIKEADRVFLGYLLLLVILVMAILLMLGDL